MSDHYVTRYTLLQRAPDQKDAHAWEEFIDFYKNYIYVIIRSMNMRHHDTEDLMQQVSIKLWKNLPQYVYTPGKAKFRGWVSTVTRNEVLMFIRKQKNLAAKMERLERDATLNYLEAIRLPELEQIAEREWQIFVTNTALKTIEIHFSEAAIKAFKLANKGMKVSDIAQELDVKDDSVYKYISRVKARFITEIQKLKDELNF